MVSPEIIYTQTTLNRLSRFIYIFMHLNIWVAITNGEGEAINLSGNWGDTGTGFREGHGWYWRGRKREKLNFNFFKSLIK